MSRSRGLLLMMLATVSLLSTACDTTTVAIVCRIVDCEPLFAWLWGLGSGPPPWA